MAKARSNNKKPTTLPKVNDQEAVMETVRSIWAATEQVDPQTRAWLQKTVADGIERIKRQVTGKLKIASLLSSPDRHAAPAPIPEPGPKQPRSILPKQDESLHAGRTVPTSTAVPDRQKSRVETKQKPQPLFEEKPALRALPSPKPAKPLSAPVVAIPRFPESELRVYSKELVPPALKFIPKAAQFADMASYRKHLGEALPFNAIATRKRNASYLIGRYFPGERLHCDLVAFAAAAKDHRALGDVLFYLTCRTEKMVAMVAESLIWPSLADGGLPRTRIQDFIQAHFPQFKNPDDLRSAIVRTYTGFGVATANRTRVSVSQRQGHLAALAYIMYLEFPEPGMYSFDKLLDGPMHKWLLWERKWIAEQLYMLRHFKLLSKVSEIDNIRQFTTKYSLAEAVEHILPLLKEEQP